MAVLYVSKSYKEAEQWADYFASLGRPTYSVAKIKVNGRVFCGDAYKCFEGSIVEVLVDGEIEVIEIMKEVNANI